MEGMIYVCGGFDVRSMSHRRRHDRLKCVERYDPSLNRWERIPSSERAKYVTMAIQGHCMLLYNPYTMIVLGGFNGDDRLTSVCTWKIGHLSWSEDEPPMRSKRSNFSACFFDDKLVVAGGYSVSSTIAGVEQFDGTEWTDLPDLPTNRSAMKIIVLPDFRDFAVSKLGNEETRKKWLEQEKRITIEKSG
ncbi:kelch repeat protein [Ancylostoma ceylanicum]|uniref:Kelch repeat protein n=1 Tax=Ancylostoma ceylanicum TaxID=53326 RepID=A0A0D6LIU0_9BILA|nr:kelch repeat protein [Ancylostoma ceylanicum]